MNELVISASMEIGVMLEAVTSDIAVHLYSLRGPASQCARPSKTPWFSDDKQNFWAGRRFLCDVSLQPSLDRHLTLEEEPNV
jgi:hypothetical protein